MHRFCLYIATRVLLGIAGLSWGPVPADASEPILTPLLPGLVVDELPLRLPNINNLRFAPDGRLTALGYNGLVYVIEDADGDGLEDTAHVFWDQPTLRVPVGMAWSERGLYVSSHGKVSLLEDTDGDGRADTEQVVSEGWPPTDVRSGGVDATAVTVDEAGQIYFALICANYSNPYRLQDGTAHYDRSGLRGTILRLSADHTRREVLSTGLRVPYTLAFNRHGDLFCTDQEGETWLPGGNPLDELNHIVPGRHYGFPPRHDEYLSDVDDEPPVVAFGPQHQSTCGLVFNEARAGQVHFGPTDWEGDALVAGFSRGRLWRVRLIKTPHGYVGRQVPLAVGSMLLADLAVSPAGDLYVTCHSGPPDWGTGPQGEGRLYRLRFTDASVPQPIVAYSAGPLEVRVAFDRPLAASVVDAIRGPSIRYGEHVRAGDQWESLKPPYAAVEVQAAVYRGELAIVAAKLSGDGRTLVLQTAPHPVRGQYALALPGMNISATATPAATATAAATTAAETATMELDYNLAGLQAEWIPRQADAAAWSGWLPHVDLSIAQALCADSWEHRALFRQLETAGTLRLRGWLELPRDAAELRLTSTAPCRLRDGDGEIAAARGEDGRYVATIATHLSSERRRLEVIVEASGNGAPHLELTFRRAGDDRQRVVALDQLWVPWAPPPLTIDSGSESEKESESESASGSESDSSAVAAAALVGDPRRGEQIFFGQKAKCGECHAVGGRGALLGPDLSDVAQRSVESVLRDIREPSAAINPDYLSYSVALSDGRVLTGTIRAAADGTLLIADSQAKQITVPIDNVEQVSPQSTSMMPTGLLDGLTGADVDDLVAFLMTPPTPAAAPPSTSGAEAPTRVEPPRESPPAPDVPSSAFPQRTVAEVATALDALPAPRDEIQPNSAPLVVTLLAGKQDHGPGEHDYPAWQASWSELLQGVPRVTLHRAFEWPTAHEWRESDVVVFYLWNHDWSAQRLAEVDAYLARGGGIVLLHAALISDDDPESLATRWGLAAQPRRTRYRHGPTELHFADAEREPLVAGFTRLALVDETYWPLIGDRTKVNVLATAVEEGRDWPMLWTYQAGRGRVWASVIGHYSATLDDPLYRILVLRGVAWAAGAPLHALQRAAALDLSEE